MMEEKGAGETVLGRAGTEVIDRLGESGGRNRDGEAMGIESPKPVTEGETPFLSQGLQPDPNVTDSPVLIGPE